MLIVYLLIGLMLAVMEYLDNEMKGIGTLRTLKLIFLWPVVIAATMIGKKDK